MRMGNDYCTSRRKKAAKSIADIFSKYGFVGSFFAVRESKERYADNVEILQPVNVSGIISMSRFSNVEVQEIVKGKSFVVIYKKCNLSEQ